MNNYRLEELSEFIRNGASIKQFENAKGYPITRIETISDSYVNLERVGYADIMEFGKYEEYLLDIGDILMSHINSDKHLGKTAIFENENVKLIHGMNLLCIRPNKKIVSPKYLNYYFKSLDFKKQLPKITKKSVNQASFSVSDLKKLKCKIHSIENQKKIVEILDKSQELIDKRKKQIEELDLLVKSKFIEMFGDQNTNSKNLEKVYLKDISELITKGASPNWQGIEYVDDDTQTLFVTSENVREGYIDLSKKKYLMDAFNEKQKRSILNNGDFLINIVGASIGRAAQFNLDIKANINQAVALVRIKKGLVNDKYMLEYLNSPKALQMYKSMQVSVARANLSLQNINDLEILLPPMELQNQFANFVKQVDKLKFEMEKSLKELEENFNSLMQKIFKLDLL